MGRKDFSNPACLQHSEPPCGSARERRAHNGCSIPWFACKENFDRRIALGMGAIVSGAVNLIPAFALGASIPAVPNAASAPVVGLLAHAVRLALFIVGLRHLGTARTGACFSVAPFFGALLALPMGELVTMPLLFAGARMAPGTWLRLTGHHDKKMPAMP